MEEKLSLQQKLAKANKLSALGLHKILLNLIGNSLEVVEETGMVNVSTENC